MNIYEKLQKARVELQDLNLKMGGYNKFADFKYFELKDFLPEINKIFNKLKLFSKFDLLENGGVLTIINAEKIDEQVTFTTPKAEIILKGQNGLQMIGSTHTYLKRYCYLNALEIVEDDIVNATIDKDKSENQNSNFFKSWRGKRDEKYYYVDTHNGYVATTSEKGFEDDDFNHEIGNYFKTLELAEKYLSDLKEFSRKWHEKNGSHEKEEE